MCICQYPISLIVIVFGASTADMYRISIVNGSSNMPKNWKHFQFDAIGHRTQYCSFPVCRILHSHVFRLYLWCRHESTIRYKLKHTVHSIATMSQYSNWNKGEQIELSMPHTRRTKCTNKIEKSATRPQHHERKTKTKRKRQKQPSINIMHNVKLWYINVCASVWILRVRRHAMPLFRVYTPYIPFHGYTKIILLDGDGAR